MQIAIALLVAAAIGVALHYALPHRESRGAAVAPMIAAAAGAVTWAALTWAGVGIESPWIWLAALVVPALITVPVVVLLSSARVRGDARERARLGIG